MIDTRFPPKPERVLVPLYPTKSAPVFTQSANPDHELDTVLSLTMQCGNESFVVGGSASALLRDYLSLESPHGTNLRVAVPSFACESLVRAIIDSGREPVFYDIGNNGEITEDSCVYAQESGAGSFIWPNYFGTRVRSEQTISLLRKAAISIIFDDAQSDPFSPQSKNLRDKLSKDEIVLYSFGWSKLLAGPGGGMIYGDATANHVLCGLREHLGSQPLQADAATSLVRDALLSLLASVDAGHLEKIGLVKPGYERLDVLLESEQPSMASPSRINPNHAQNIINRLQVLHDLKIRHYGRYLEMREIIAKSIGEDALQYINEIEGAPTVLAIRVNNARRYKIMEGLSKLGVQSTWYYYPLNSLKRYNHYYSQSEADSLTLAGSILMLPFQPFHSEKQFRLLREGVAAVEGIERE